MEFQFCKMKTYKDGQMVVVAQQYKFTTIFKKTTTNIGEDMEKL